MKTEIKRIDRSLPLPIYGSKGAVAFDFYARETMSIQPKEVAFIPLNAIIKIPVGYFLLVAARSSLPCKKKLCVPHGIGIIDQDYCGENDEIRLEVLNFSDSPVSIEKGERVAQGIFVKFDKPEWNESGMRNQSRGGWGSTGGYHS